MSLQAFFDNFALLADAPNGIGKLRELILGLAFRGKLVPQLPDEGIPGLLVEEIESVKSRLQSERDIPKTTRLPSIAEDEMQHEIPSTWQWARLGEVVAYDCSQKVTAKQIPADAWLLELEDIEKDSSRIIQRFKYSDRHSKSNKTRFVIGDVLYGKLRPYLNKVVVADANGYCTTEIVTLRGYYGVEPKFLMYALKRPDFVVYINEKSYGTKMPRLGSADARLSVFPLPPIGEQKRIVVKVDELMRLCDKLEERKQLARESCVRLNNTMLGPLNRVASLTSEEFNQATTRLADNFDKLYDSIDTVSKLRSTILQLAVQGKLVPQVANEESAAVLLENIKEPQRRLTRDGKIKNGLTLPPINSSKAPFELPLGWTWARFPELGEFGRGRSKHRPRNAPELYVAGKYKLVQTGDVARANGIITTFTGLYNELGLAQSRIWPAGTMCITIAANIADSGILGFDACFPDSVVGFIPSSIIGGAEYFEYFMRTAKSHLQDFAPSTAQKNINVSILQDLLIPLPPLQEQKRIVAKVNHLMGLCDELERQLRNAEANSERLMNAAVQHVLQTVYIRWEEISTAKSLHI